MRTKTRTCLLFCHVRTSHNVFVFFPPFFCLLKEKTHKTQKENVKRYRFEWGLQTYFSHLFNFEHFIFRQFREWLCINNSLILDMKHLEKKRDYSGNGFYWQWHVRNLFGRKFSFSSTTMLFFAFFDENETEAQIPDDPTCTNSRLSPVSTSITHSWQDSCCSEIQRKRLFNHLQATISNIICRLFRYVTVFMISS